MPGRSRDLAYPPPGVLDTSYTDWDTASKHRERKIYVHRVVEEGEKERGRRRAPSYGQPMGIHGFLQGCQAFVRIVTVRWGTSLLPKWCAGRNCGRVLLRIRDSIRHGGTDWVIGCAKELKRPRCHLIPPMPRYLGLPRSLSAQPKTGD